MKKKTNQFSHDGCYRLQQVVVVVPASSSSVSLLLLSSRFVLLFILLLVSMVSTTTFAWTTPFSSKQTIFTCSSSRRRRQQQQQQRISTTTYRTTTTTTCYPRRQRSFLILYNSETGAGWTDTTTTSTTGGNDMKNSNEQQESQILSNTKLSSSSVSVSLPTNSSNHHFWTMEQLKQYSLDNGVVISLSTLGPAYRAIARSTYNTSLILGYVEGFIRPTGQILHLDKMEVYKKIITKVRYETKNTNYEFRGSGNMLGIGLLLGYICLIHGLEQGCTKAEFLAIHDEDYQHERLVKYYKNSGFKIIKYVGDDWKSIPDRLIWGGCGTLLREDIQTLLLKWTTLLETSQRKQKIRFEQLQLQQQEEVSTEISNKI